jgi:hypothetical protein
MGCRLQLVMIEVRTRMPCTGRSCRTQDTDLGDERRPILGTIHRGRVRGGSGRGRQRQPDEERGGENMLHGQGASGHYILYALCHCY